VNIPKAADTKTPALPKAEAISAHAERRDQSHDDVVRDLGARGMQGRMHHRQDGRDQRAAEDHVVPLRQVVLREHGDDLLGIDELGLQLGAPLNEAGGGKPEKHRQQADDDVHEPARDGAPACDGRRAGAEKARDELDGDERSEEGHSHGFGYLKRRPMRLGGKSQVIGRHAFQRRRHAARRNDDGDRQHDEPDDDGSALQEVGDRVGQQAADDRIGRDQHRRQDDGVRQGHVGAGAQHLAEGADLRRRPEHRAGQQDDHHQLLDAGGETRAKHVGERGDALAPEHRGIEEAGGDHGQPVGEGIDERA